MDFLGHPELKDDPRFTTPVLRRTNWSALLEVVRAGLDRFDSVDAAVAALSAARIPAAPMLSPEALVHHPQMTARAAFPEISHPARGTVKVTATPFFVDGQPVHPAGPAPYQVGEHTTPVLRDWLGYSSDKIAALLEQKIIVE